MYLMALLFSLPIFVFGRPDAAVGGMTIGHGFQYCSWWDWWRRGTPGDLPLAPAGRVRHVALVGERCSAAASHLHGFPPAIRLVFGAYLGVVTAHFRDRRWILADA